MNVECGEWERREKLMMTGDTEITNEYYNHSEKLFIERF